MKIGQFVFAILAAGCIAAGCIRGEPTGSREVLVVDGEWVRAPSVSDGPVLADEVPAGVDAWPVDLWLVDGKLVVCEDAVPVDGTEDDDEGNGGKEDTDGAGPTGASAGLGSDALGGGDRSAGDAVREDLAWLHWEDLPDIDVTAYT